MVGSSTTFTTVDRALLARFTSSAEALTRAVRTCSPRTTALKVKRDQPRPRVRGLPHQVSCGATRHAIPQQLDFQCAACDALPGHEYIRRVRRVNLDSCRSLDRPDGHIAPEVRAAHADEEYGEFLAAQGRIGRPEA